MEMHFFILNNDIFSGQQVWATFGEIGSPYPPPPECTECVRAYCSQSSRLRCVARCYAQRLEEWGLSLPDGPHSFTHSVGISTHTLVTHQL